MFEAHPNRRIPRTMATQHPDNAGVPYWGEEAFVSSQQETEEVFHNFEDLGVDEYMWDWEGKFADEAMVERLLTAHLDYFRKNQLGRDRFITLRVPNVWEEKTFKLARAYMSVLSAGEFSESLKLDQPPVFEFILPMTKRADQLLHIQETFQKTAKVHEQIFGADHFGNGYIHIIPLFESVDDLMNCAEVLEEFLAGHEQVFGSKPPYLRVFIARSDPALNAGFVPAVLASRMAIREIYRIGKKHGIPMYPIVGTGSLPFRGGVNPENLETILHQYEGVKTITLQSAFRYDYPLEEVKVAMEILHAALENPKAVEFSDEEFEGLRQIVKLFQEDYTSTLMDFAPFINEMAVEVPNRRERIQHTGLFGYSRGVGELKLPRAIKFTAACYSWGIPPEFMGTGRAVKKIQELGLMPLLEQHFFSMKSELKHAGKYLNLENLERFAQKESWASDILEDIHQCENLLNISLGPEKAHHYLHRNLTSNIFLKHSLGLDFSEDLLEAAVMRKSLG